MAGRSAILSVKILTDASDASKGFDQAGSKLDRFQSGLRKAAVPAAIAAGAVLAFGKSAAESASRTEQAMGAVDTVFGRSAGKVKKWADGAATSVGLATSQYGELASTMGAMLKNIGVPVDQVAGKTRDLIKMGADLAATYGGTTADAVDALGSALRGETDPIERYGISIKQATIEAEMAAEGTDKLKGAQAQAAKSTALLTLLHKQAGPAVGAFARESDTAAHSQQVAAAQYENAKSALGMALLPAISAVTSKLGALAQWLGKHTTLAHILAAAILVIAGAIFALIAALKVYDAVLRVIKIAQAATWASALGPIALVLAAIALVVAAFVILWKNSQTFRNIVRGVWSAVQAAAKAAANVLKSAWSGALAAVRGYLAVWKAVFTVVIDVIRGAVRAVVAIFKGDWRGAFEAVRGIVNAFKQFFVALFHALPGPVQDVLTSIRTKVQSAFDKITGAVDKVTDVITAPFDAASDALETMVGWVQDLVGWLDRIHIPDLGSIGGLIHKIPGLGMAPAPPAGAATSPTLSRGARSPVGGPAAVAGGGGPTIVVQGALDPEAVARQIQRILTGHQRRQGLRTA